MLGVIAVAGRSADHERIAVVSDMPEAEVIEALRAAVAGQLLVVQTATSGDERYAFRHALVQEVVYDELLPGERRLLHRAHAEALEARPPRDAREAAGYWAELAHHWSAARDDPRAFAAGLHAADAAEHAFAFEAALAQYECVLELWPGVPDAAEIAGIDRVRMLSRAAMTAELGGVPNRNVALRREAVAAEDGSDPVRAAVLRESLGRALFNQGDTKAAIEVSEAAVALMPARAISRTGARAGRSRPAVDAARPVRRNREPCARRRSRSHSRSGPVRPRATRATRWAWTSMARG